MEGPYPGLIACYLRHASLKGAHHQTVHCGLGEVIEIPGQGRGKIMDGNYGIATIKQVMELHPAFYIALA